MESMLLEIPVIAADVPGSRTLIRHGENGLLVPFGDGPALAAALRQVMDDRDLAARLALAGRQTVLHDFDETRVADRIEEVYRQVLGQGRPQLSDVQSEKVGRCAMEIDVDTLTDLRERYREHLPAARRRPLPQLAPRLLFAAADLASVLASLFLSLAILRSLALAHAGTAYSILAPTLLIFASTYLLVGVNRPRPVNKVELRLLFLTIPVFLSLLAFNPDGRRGVPAAGISPGLAAFHGGCAAGRGAARHLGAAMGLWGEPVVVIGSGPLSHQLVSQLLRQPEAGLKPVLMLEGRGEGYEPLPVPVTGEAAPVPVMTLDRWPATSSFGPQIGVSTAIVVVPELPGEICEAVARGEHLGFDNIITVNRQFNARTFGLIPIDFGGVLGFEERHYELNPFDDYVLRALDLALILLALPLLLPVFLLIGLAIKLDSKGPVFYRQTRIGRGAEEFKVLKFRTMVQNADQVLEQVLNSDPALRAEWEADHKLRSDPRITRVGRFLRKASLDELPQLWNVFKGEMSLVGPRPIVRDEIPFYGDLFKFYAQVRPGLSGLWQVSGRNDIGYHQRVRLTSTMCANRSFWMNLHIIIQTIPAVLRRHGAYWIHIYLLIYILKVYRFTGVFDSERFRRAAAINKRGASPLVLLLVLMALGAGAGYAISLRQTPAYQATTTVLVGQITQASSITREDVQAERAVCPDLCRPPCASR